MNFAKSSMESLISRTKTFFLDAIFDSAGEEECPQCSSKFIRAQGKIDPNNPQNLICQSCYENAQSTTNTTTNITPAAKSTSSSSSSAVNLYHGGRSMKREKKVSLESKKLFKFRYLVE